MPAKAPRHRTRRREATSPWPFRGLLFFTFILVLSPQSFYPFLSPLRPAMVSAMLAILAYVAGRSSNNEPIFDFEPEPKIALYLLAWATFCVPWSIWPGGTLSVIVEQFAKSVIIFVLIGRVVDSPDRLRRMLWALSLMVAAPAIFGIREYLTGGSARIEGYPAPLSSNPNDLALLLNLVLPLTAALFFSSRSPFARLVLLCVIALQLGGVLSTYSRGGFVTLVLLGLIFLKKTYGMRERSYLLAAMIVALLCVPFLPSRYWDRIATITAMESDTTGSSEERWSSMVHAAGVMLDHPVLGVGLGMNRLALNQARGTIWVDVHNVYLQIGSELGIPGLVLYLLLVQRCLAGVAMARRSAEEMSTSHDLPRICLGIEVSLYAFLAAAMFHPVAYHMYFPYIAGLAVASKAISNKIRSETTTDLAAASSDERGPATHKPSVRLRHARRLRGT